MSEAMGATADISCESCGMPIETGRYCAHCTDADGRLQPFEERFERMVAWQARRTPATTLDRLNGSLTPLRLTTARTASSTVVNRRPHFGHDRRRRVVAPSSASRESMTRLSGL